MSNNLTEYHNAALALFSQDTAPPAHITDDMAGNENVNTEDLAIPTIKLLQALNPEVADYEGPTEDAPRPGQFYNTATRELSSELYVINLFYRRGFPIFRDRKAGGGLYGQYDTLEAANEAMRQAPGSDASGSYSINETHRHYLMTVDPVTGDTSVGQFYMSGTKLNVSRQWNTSILQQHNDKPRFSSVWLMKPIKRSNNSGTWYNPVVTFAGWTPEGLFEKAKTTYEAISARQSAADDLPA